MICLKCKTKMKKIKTDYKYTESGLQNVILKGITAYKCPQCRGINPIISKIKEVHKTIAQQLLKKDSLLTGKEIVYLRKEMNIKAKDLAQTLGVTKVTVSRWENEKEQISPACDRLIRLLYNNRIFRQTCEIVRPGLDKLESQIMKSILISLCEPKISIEDIFRNIKRRHIHSKISIPISNLNFLAGALDSNLNIELLEQEGLTQARSIGAIHLSTADYVSYHTVPTTASLPVSEPTKPGEYAYVQ
jgi:putative zinc finger/helix-turn-helix YgiT family protein